MGRLTTHVLDTASGRPAAGVRITLHRNVAERYALVRDAVTNGDGRCDAPLLEGSSFAAGRYRLTFAVGVMQQTVSGVVDVLDDAVRMDIEVPGVLGLLAGALRDKLQSAGQKLLK